MEKRVLGKSNIEISAIGMGCWAIGGPFFAGTMPLGWGATDDRESLGALKQAFDMGVTFFDTADVYGTGHGERLVGQAFRHMRDQVVIATKFGNKYDEERKQITGQAADPAFIVGQCERSLQRLATDYIDLYQFHINDYALAKIDPVIETLEALVEQGKIRSYGWSTDHTTNAEAIAPHPHCGAIQFQQNMLDPNWELSTVTKRYRVAAINRGPLAMGLLSGKYTAATTVSVDDVRGEKAPEWMQYFQNGKPHPAYVARLAALRELLTADSRSLAQGALAWILSVGEHAVPIPGIRTVEQATENFASSSCRLFSDAHMAEIEQLLGR